MARTKPSNPLPFYCDCVGWDRNDVNCEGGLSDLIDNRIEIKRAAFVLNVDKEDREELEKNLGYSKDFRITQDYHVEYFRSKHHEAVVYGIQHSAIEYVFAERV